MNIPERINHRWIATLNDDQLIAAEAEVHAVFDVEKQTEKRRRGTRYVLLEGPATLVNAWQRWSLLSNEARSRGLTVHRHA